MYGQRVVKYNPLNVVINKTHSVNTEEVAEIIEEVPRINTKDTNMDKVHVVSLKIQ